MLRNLFNKSSFGLEIGDDSIKFIELTTDKNSLKLGRYGEHLMPFGVGGLNKLKNSDPIAKILPTLRTKEGIKSAFVSLSKEDIKNRKDYLSLFNKSGIKVRAFESQMQAIARAVVRKGDNETYMVVDFDRTRALAFIVSGGVVFFFFTSEISGMILNGLIQKNFGVSLSEAEKMKQRHGLVRDKSNEKLFTTMLDGVSILRDEIEKHFLYWHIYKNKENKKNPGIKKIILCGSEAGLPGLSEYLSVGLRNRVELANVWVNVLNIEKHIPEISFGQSLGFAAAIGVALKDF